MALDEPQETDSTFDIDGFKYVINSDFFEKAKPIKVEFADYGFKLSAGIDFGSGGGGCAGCGSTCS